MQGKGERFSALAHTGAFGVPGVTLTFLVSNGASCGIRLPCAQWKFPKKAFLPL